MIIFTIGLLHLEYVGNIPVEKRDEVLTMLNNETARLIEVRVNAVIYVSIGSAYRFINLKLYFTMPRKIFLYWYLAKKVSILIEILL